MIRASQIILLATAFVVCGCRRSADPSVSDPTASDVAPTASELADFALRSHLALPGSARFVRYHRKDGSDTAVWLQFRLPAAELSSFLAAVAISPEQLHPGSVGGEATLYYFRAWLPVAPRRFQYAEAWGAPGCAVKCVLDLDDPQTAMVYLMYFTTPLPEGTAPSNHALQRTQAGSGT